MSNKNLMFFLFSITTGVFYGLAWMSEILFPILFWGISPLIYLPLKDKKPNNFNVIIYLFILSWQTTTIDWILSTNLWGGVFTLLINSLILSIPLFLYGYIVQINKLIASILLVSSWISLEKLHLSWELNFPFFNLGNGLAGATWMIQWYEYTGVLGGSFWIIITNILFANVLFLKKKKSYYTLLGVFTIPILSSFIIPVNRLGTSKNIITVHSNLDARSEKYDMSTQGILNYYKDLINPYMSDTIDFIILPESALPDGGWFNDRFINKNLKQIREISKQNKNAKFLVGAIVYDLFIDDNNFNNEKYYLEYLEDSQIHYYTHTGVFYLDSNTSSTQFRSKEKLVPFEETYAYPKVLSQIRKIFGTLGGFTFSTMKKQPTVFKGEIKSSYLICFEVLYGEIARKMVANGAEILFMGSNESWLNNIKAARQFTMLAKLRAIETRKYICKSSNDGSSAIINNKGRIIREISGFESGVMSTKIYAIRGRTFYVIFGDIIGKISLFILPVITLVAIKIKWFYN